MARMPPSPPRSVRRPPFRRSPSFSPPPPRRSPRRALPRSVEPATPRREVTPRRQVVRPRAPATPRPREQVAQGAPRRLAAPQHRREAAPAAPIEAAPIEVAPAPIGPEGFQHLTYSYQDLDLTYLQFGALNFRTIPQQFNPFVNPFVSNGIWSFSPRAGLAQISTLGRRIGDIHFTYRQGARDAVFYICVLDGPARLKWIAVARGFSHPLYPTHVLYQRGKSAPRWILVRTYSTYVRIYDGKFSVTDVCH
ncbi:hypothetical protein FRC09_001457 [Ceratobasidium sp. 395]|nr:hypothetical protein FRC09_001457 [Ceratobasidium sp. 395]